MPRVARWLRVRDGEGRLAALVAALFAGIEAARGFGEIGANALFISRFGEASLPWLFIGLGIVSLVAGLTYGTALGRVPRRRLFAALFTGIGGLLVLERFGLVAGEAVLPLLWLTVYAAGLLAVTIVWTLAGAVFDARQARRLFPLCTSAAMVGSLAGTLGAGPVARLLGTETLVLVEGLLFVAAAALVVAIARHAAAVRTGSLDAPPARGSTAAALLAGWNHVRRSPLMRLVAVAYVLFSVLAFSVTYPFLTAMAGAFPDEADLAAALGLLFAAVTASSLLVSLAIAGRVFARVGVAGAALALPIVYVGGFATWLVSFNLVTAAGFTFAQQVTQRGISNAAWSAFYNVVPGERRAQVLAFIDGVPGQLGTTLSGVLLLVGARVLAPDQVFWLGLGTAVALTAVVVAIRRRYADSLVRTLRSGLGERMLEGGPGLAALSRDAGVAGDLVHALASSEAPVRRMAADLLGQVGGPECRDALAGALRDEDAGVRVAALDALAAVGVDDTGDAVVLALDDPDPLVRAAAVRAVSALDGRAAGSDRASAAGSGAVPSADRLATDPSPAVRAAIAVALVRAGEEDRPHELLRALLESPEPEDRIRGLEAVGELGGHSPSARLPELLHDPAPEVRAAAVAAGAVVDRGDDGDPRADAADGAEGADPRLLGALADEAVIVRRAAVAALRARPGAAAALAERLETGSPREQEAALEALEGNGRAVRDRILAWAGRQVERATELRRQHAALTAAGVPDAPDRSRAFLAALVARRRDEIEDRLLRALAVLGAPEASGLLRRCLRSGDPETRAQAIEALDSIGDRALGAAIVRLLEDEPDRRAGARDEAVQRLIDDPDPWIRALAIRTRAESLADDWAVIHRRAREDDDPIVRRAIGPRLEQGEPPMPEEVRTLDDLERMLFLRRVPLFRGLAPEDLQRIAMTATERFYAPEEALVREGDVGDELVVIVEGTVRIMRADGGEPRFIRRYGAGDHIGELAVLRERPRAATVIAEEPGVRGLVIAGRGLTAILRERPEAAMAMLATLAERIGSQ